MLVRPGTLMSSSAGTGEGALPFLSEASALFAAMSSQPDATRQTLIDDTIGALKAAGIWDDLDVLYVMAAHDEQASRLNWKSPADYTLLTLNAPIFEVDRGWTGDPGGGGRLRTQFVASTDAVQYTLDDASVWLWWRSGVASTATDFGDTVSPRSVIQANSSGATAAGAINTTNLSSFANAATAPGLVGMQRTTSTHQRLFKDGVQVGADAAEVSTAIPANEWWVCGRASDSSSRQIAAVAWGASLTGKEAAFYAALDTYMQAVGAA